MLKKDQVDIVGDIASSMEVKIRDIVKEYGKEIILDRKRFMSMVDDLCPQEKLMRELLSVCLQKFPAENLLEKAEHIDPAKPNSHPFFDFAYEIVYVRKDITMVDAKRAVSILFYGLTGIYVFEDIRSIRQDRLFVLEAAKQGNPNSQIYAAIAFEKGDGGIRINQDEAIRWHKKLAKKGRVKSQRALGLLLSSDENRKERYPEAFEWMKKAADSGSVEAAYHTGRFYDTGLGVEPDAQKAFAYYEIAAGKKHVEASYQLGLCYARGKGVEKNITRAIEILNTVADSGYSDALLFIAYCYSRGEGVERDPNKAFKLYEKAAALGNAQAMHYIGVCYAYGDGVEKDEKKAELWYKRAAEQGDKNAAENLKERELQSKRADLYKEEERKSAAEQTKRAENQGDASGLVEIAKCYMKGVGVKKDEKIGFYFLMQAAEKNSMEAMYLIGSAYQYGIGIDKNLKNAVDFYLRAAQMGHAEAMFCVGRCFELGDGVDVNPKQAMDFYLEAAKRGSSNAIQKLQTYINHKNV